MQPREDFQLAKVQITLRGWLFDPRFGYNAYVWTSQTSQGLGAQVVAAGNINWTFNDARYRSLVAVPEGGDGAPVVLNGLRVYNTSKYVGAAALDLIPSLPSLRIRLSGNWVGPYSPFDGVARRSDTGFRAPRCGYRPGPPRA